MHAHMQKSTVNRRNFVRGPKTRNIVEKMDQDHVNIIMDDSQGQNILGGLGSFSHGEKMWR
jgi:hypothetical protein